MMLNVMETYYDLRETMDDAAAKKIAGYLGKVYDEVRDTVKTSDFHELTETVGELADAQKRTDNHVEELANAVEGLADAQKRTETRMEELADAQKRTETRMEELADAQKRTDASMKEMADAQKRTDASMKEMAEGQKLMQEALRDLAGAHKSLAQQVGGLSNTLGGDLEDIAYSMLCHFLPHEFGWKVGELTRVWKDWGGKELDEIDIFAQAIDPKRPDIPIWIVGEAKHNLTMKEVKHFIRQVGRARRHLEGEVFPLCFCYRARPDVQQKAQEADIRILFSYGKMI